MAHTDRVDSPSTRNGSDYALSNDVKACQHPMEVAWIITGVGVPGALSLGGMLIGESSTIAHWGACVAFLVSATWLGVMGAVWWRRHKERNWTIWLRGAGMAAYVIILIPFLVWLAWPVASAQTQPPSINGNCNAVGNGNSNCSPYINEAPPPKVFPTQESQWMQDGTNVLKEIVIGMQSVSGVSAVKFTAFGKGLVSVGINFKRTAIMKVVGAPKTGSGWVSIEGGPPASIAGIIIIAEHPTKVKIQAKLQ